MQTLRVALWVTDLSCPVADLDAWLALLRTKAQEARAQQAQVLLLPEYSCLHWLAFAPDMTGDAYLPWLASLHAHALAGVCTIARETGMTIIPGTLPVPADGAPPPLCHQPNDRRSDSSAPRFYNRAFVIGPDGQVAATQDKLALTPWELDEKNWNIQPGGALTIFEVGGVRCAILICLDVEQPALATRLFEEGAEVILVPSMTLNPSGHSRVFLCARARAIEGMVGVAAVGAVGEPPVLVGKETNYSGAGVFVPCEMDLAADGVAGEVAPSFGMNMHPGDMLVADIPVGKIRQKKTGQPEAWPGLVTL